MSGHKHKSWGHQLFGGSSGILHPASFSRWRRTQPPGPSRSRGEWLNTAASVLGAAAGRAKHAIDASRLPASLYDVTRKRLRSHLYGARRAPAVEVRTVGRRGGPGISHPMGLPIVAPQFHIIHDRAQGHIQVIGEGGAENVASAHQMQTAPSTARPATGTGNPNMDIPIIHNLESIAHHIIGGIQDIAHIFEGK